MASIGTMQGRLVPPVDDRIQFFPHDRWAEEFPLAAQASLDCIEWIYDLESAAANPLGTDAGIGKIKAMSAGHRVRVLSLCAGYFIDRPLVRAGKELEDRLAVLHWLMRRCQLLGVERLVLPFLDASRIESEAEIDAVASVLDRFLPVAEETGVEIHLETSLKPALFAGLLDRHPHRMLKVVYDSGNSSSLGYHPHEEFAAYGVRVGSVHIKDRVRNGSTVPLGTGDTDFRSVFECLEAMHYSGDFVLEAARGVPGEEVEWAKRNRDFVLDHLARARQSADRH